MWSIVLTMDINGPLKGKGFTVFKKEMSTSVTRISIPDVETLLLQHIKHDFPDKACEEKQEMSQEDIHFMKSAVKTADKVDGHIALVFLCEMNLLKISNKRRILFRRQ